MNTYEKRNLAEQVEKNKQDILKHFQRDEVLADFGIRIIGQLDSAAELPESADEYGDAYAVGTQSPFNYFIWTRANNLSPSDYWFDFGEIAIAGPQGPKGDRGAKGDTGQSTRWYLMSDAAWSYDATGKKPGDMVLLYPSGNVHMMGDNGYFAATGNIRGPVGPKGDKGLKGDKGDPGPQGPQGPTGDVGGFINLAGIVNTEYDLPDPEAIQNLTVAFLVGFDEPYDLYIQVGSTSATAEWFNAGPLNVATFVSAGGVYQNVWNADTKLDKITTPTANNQVYVKSFTGAQTMVEYTQTPYAWRIASYDGEGNLKTEAPVEFKDCINLEYFNAHAGGGWNKLEFDNNFAGENGTLNFDTSLQGHLINLMIEVDYHRFSDWNDKNSTVFGPVAFRLPGRNLKPMSTTVGGISSDTEITNQKIELSSSYYGDIGFSYAPISYRITYDGNMNYYTPEFHVYYQDLGPSFTVNP